MMEGGDSEKEDEEEEGRERVLFERRMREDSMGRS